MWVDYMKTATKVAIASIGLFIGSAFGQNGGLFKNQKPLPTPIEEYIRNSNRKNYFEKLPDTLQFNKDTVKIEEEIDEEIDSADPLKDKNKRKKRREPKEPERTLENMFERIWDRPIYEDPTEEEIREAKKYVSRLV